MKSKIQIFIALTMLVALILVYVSYQADMAVPFKPGDSPKIDDISSSKAALSRYPGFPLKEIQSVDFYVNYGNYGTRDRLQREDVEKWRDQLRDWLMMTILGDAGLTAESLGGVIFDLPPIRYGYLHAFGQFEYGGLRSAYTGGGRVLALIPDDLSDEEKSDAIGGIVDRHRKNQAGGIKQIDLFEYSLPKEGEPQNAQLTRLPAIDVALYLTSTTGYHEQDINSLEALESFLQKTDYLTYVDVTDDRLRLGGRKTQSTAYEFHGAGLQEVAAVWQSYQAIDKLDKFVERTLLYAHKGIDGSVNHSEIEKRAEKKMLALGLPNHASAPGFSLDPTFDFAKLRDNLDLLIRNAEESWDNFELANPIKKHEEGNEFQLVRQKDWKRLRSQLRDALQAFANENVKPLNDILETLPEQRRQNLSEAIILSTIHIQGERLQRARYNGLLQGTEAGMVLFYTDLLAKLWTIDFQGSAPNKIENKDTCDIGFLDDTEVIRSLSSLYHEESRIGNGVRLWFGFEESGFQADNNRLYFQPISTRLYTAGRKNWLSNEEAQASAFFTASLQWWDDHYEYVARCEPQYFRLNEIMKWSVLIAFLSRTETAALLNFFANIPDEDTFKNYRFKSWSRDNASSLKFKHWEFLKYRDISESETLEFPQGEVSGGVSLAELNLFRDRAGINRRLRSKNENSLRADIDFSRDKVETARDHIRLTMRDGSRVALQNKNTNTLRITNTPKADLLLRGWDSDIRINSPLQRDVTVTGEKLKVQVEVDGVRLGAFKSEKSASGFRAQWEQFDREIGETLALRASLDGDVEGVFAAEPLVTHLVRMPEPDTYAVKLRNSEKWMLANIGGDKDLTVSDGWQARTAYPRKGAVPFRLRWEDQSEVEGKTGKRNWVVFRLLPSPQRVVSDLSNTKPPSRGAARIEVDMAGERRDVVLENGALYFDLRGHPLDLAMHLELEQFKLVRSEAEAGKSSVSLSSASVNGRNIDIRDTRTFAKWIATKPEEARVALYQALTREFNRLAELIKADRYDDAYFELARMRGAYDVELPEFLLLAGLIELGQYKPAESIDSIEEYALNLEEGSAHSFFNEIEYIKNLKHGGRLDKDLDAIARRLTPSENGNGSVQISKRLSQNKKDDSLEYVAKVVSENPESVRSFFNPIPVGTGSENADVSQMGQNTAKNYLPLMGEPRLLNEVLSSLPDRVEVFAQDGTLLMELRLKDCDNDGGCDKKSVVEDNLKSLYHLAEYPFGEKNG